MSVLLVILYYKTVSRLNIFSVVKKKNGKEMLKITRNLEELITKHRKIKLDKDFIIKFKREGLISTFASVKLEIRHGPQRLRRNMVEKNNNNNNNKKMESELQHKHIEK